MPSGAIIGALRVVLGADASALEKSLKNAQSTLKSFANDVSKIALGVGLEKTVEKVFSSIVGSIKDAINAADDMGKLAQKLGLPVEELSSLKYAADLADVSLESLAKGVLKLDKNISEAQAGGTTKFTSALDKMGVSLRDSSGNVKDQTQLLDEIADKFVGYADGANKSALAQVLFGKSGADLIPLLNEGSKSLQKSREEAEKFNLIISGAMAGRAQEFNDNLRRMSQLAHGFSLVMADELIKGLVQLSNDTVEAVSDTEKLRVAFAGARDIAKWFTDQIRLAVVEVKGFGTEVSAAAKSWYEWLKAKGAQAAAADGWQMDGVMIEKAAEAEKKATEAAEEHRKVLLTNEANVLAITVKYGEWASNIDLATGKIIELKKETKDKPEAPGGFGEGQKGAFDQFVQSQQKAIATNDAFAVSLGASGSELERLKVTQLGDIAAKEQYGKVTDATRAQITALADATAFAKLQDEGAKLVWENTDPLVKYQTELANVEKAMRSVGATSDQIKLQQDKVKAKFEETSLSVEGSFGSLAGSASKLTATLGKENKAMFIASKAFAIAEVVINSHVAAMKALTLGPIAGPPAAAAMIAAGVASVAAIIATSFAQGGSFRVPGGMSSTDNHFVPLNLASGERVDITPANQVGSSSTIQVDMRGGDPYYSRGNVEKLLNAMHTVMSDGHQVQLVVLK